MPKLILFSTKIIKENNKIFFSCFSTRNINIIHCVLFVNKIKRANNSTFLLSTKILLLVYPDFVTNFKAIYPDFVTKIPQTWLTLLQVLCISTHKFYIPSSWSQASPSVYLVFPDDQEKNKGC
jgi:hypothetical protein